MLPLIRETETLHSPETLAEQFPCRANGDGRSGVVLLRSSGNSSQARYSFVAANPFLIFRAFGSRCEIVVEQDAGSARAARVVQFGNPWQILNALMSRFELLDEMDLPFPLGGCFGFWGYDLKNSTEPKLPRRAANDLELPDCHVGFYDSLAVFDHQLGKTFIVSTGLKADGSRCGEKAKAQFEFWQSLLASRPPDLPAEGLSASSREGTPWSLAPNVRSSFSPREFITAAARAQEYIRRGHIYQANLSQRLAAPCDIPGREFFQRLNAVSPAPFAAFLDCGEFQIASSSPEQFLRLSGSHIVTRPIKGTRPRGAEPARDAQLAYDLQTSA